MGQRILVVEDDRMLADVLCRSLSLSGFDVAHADTADSALERVRGFVPDLILLDVMLGNESAFDIFESLHRDGRTPIIFVSARAGVVDRLRGLRLGADDYIAKPFDLDELIARIHAVLRRAHTTVTQLRIGDTVIDLARGDATLRGGPLPLTERELEILRYLAVRIGRVVYRSELLRALWGYPDDSVNTRAVDQAIARLRKKIEPDPDHPRYIRTVRGDGYRLTPDAV
jgi:DNA-binding response OmpR family regulator